jgi:predicted 2-oxoglutarate/Fe(II)-dependent dioxygenase YbiX
MVEENGKTVLKVNHSHKSRRDCVIADKGLQERARMRVVRSIVPQIAKAYQFNATRIERYMIGCYTEADRGFFNRHRDNTTRGTAHRRFAVSVVLNDDYEGGELRFPEFGPTRYKPPAGGAVVFSCSLMHEVVPVTKGERFVFVPFLYDDAAAKIRDRNLKYIGEGVKKR